MVVHSTVDTPNFVKQTKQMGPVSTYSYGAFVLFFEQSKTTIELLKFQKHIFVNTTNLRDHHHSSGHYILILIRGLKTLIDLFQCPNMKFQFCYNSGIQFRVAC
jgi:hypothetical protein